MEDFMTETTVKAQLKRLILEFGVSHVQNLLSIAYAELCDNESESDENRSQSREEVK